MSAPATLRGSEGRVALLSGGTRGIGAAVAARLRATGWRLSLGVREPSAMDEDEATQLVAYDAQGGTEAAWVEAARERFGRIDAIVCCAGVMHPATVIAIDDAELDRMWEVNVKAPRRLVQAAWTDLRSAGAGRVVILSSLSGKRVKSAASAPYAMTKHAATALCHGVRQAGWELGIRATAICPGYVDTDMARAITNFPPERMTQTDEVARLVELALDLPATASVAEMAVSCQPEELY